MGKYFSLIYVYNKAVYKKLLIILAAVPISFAALLLVRTNTTDNADSFMLIERSFNGVIPVLLFTVINVISLLTVIGSVNGKKALKASHSTIGYTIRRLHVSPLKSYLTIFFYYILIITILLGVTISSFLIIGKAGLTLTGDSNIKARLALGLLRTDIGHALIPTVHPALIIFNVMAVIALAGECARSCFLSWHNGRHTVGTLIIPISMFIVWAYHPNDTYMLIVILLLFMYAMGSFGDVISREKKTKGDPFLVNKYVGLMDMDSTDFDESAFMEANSFSSLDSADKGSVILDKYGMAENGKKKKSLGLNPFYLRQRYLPIGINMERANFIFGACIFIGFLENITFLGSYLLKLQDIKNSITGITIDSAMKMPYFSELTRHSYYGYIIAIILVFVIQYYLCYSYYNKETKSVFVMQRLPNRKEYLRTLWVAPLIESCSIVVVMIAHTMLNLCMYILATPHAALQSDYLLHLLPF